jgi:hypothetical protein
MILLFSANFLILWEKEVGLVTNAEANVKANNDVAAEVKRHSLNKISE